MRRRKRRRMPEPDGWIICAECGEPLPVTMVGTPMLGKLDDGRRVAITDLDATDVEARMLTHE